METGRFIGSALGKESYETPTLTRFGTVEDLTRDWRPYAGQDTRWCMHIGSDIDIHQDSQDRG